MVAATGSSSTSKRFVVGVGMNPGAVFSAGLGSRFVTRNVNPEVFPKYRRSLETASTQAEIASASSGVLERVVIIVVAENAPMANDEHQRCKPAGPGEFMRQVARRRVGGFDRSRALACEHQQASRAA